MPIQRIYFEDLQIARSIIARNENVTKKFFYIKYYPLFKAIYQNYYTDAVKVSGNSFIIDNGTTCNEGVIEFINEIYVHVLTPNKETGKCQMENYRGESTLASWIKAVCLFYCYKKFKRKKDMILVDSLPYLDTENEDVGDRIIDECVSVEMSLERLNREDAETLLGLMPNERYRKIIRLRYLDLMTHEEIAKELGMKKEIYYNKHKLAKAQFERVLEKEDYYG